MPNIEFPESPKNLFIIPQSVISIVPEFSEQNKFSIRTGQIRKKRNFM